MPEHIHLLVNEPPQIVLAQFLKAVKQMTSRKLRGAREKFWQARYHDSNVHGEQARSEVIRYIHRNPVKRGLVEKPEDWAWSSFRHYARGIAGASTSSDSAWQVGIGMGSWGSAASYGVGGQPQPFAPLITPSYSPIDEGAPASYGIQDGRVMF